MKELQTAERNAVTLRWRDAAGNEVPYRPTQGPLTWKVFLADGTLAPPEQLCIELSTEAGNVAAAVVRAGNLGGRFWLRAYGYFAPGGRGPAVCVCEEEVQIAEPVAVAAEFIWQKL